MSAGAGESGEPLRGLTAAEVAERRARGEVNRVPLTTSRPIGAILWANLFTLFNGILAGAVLLLLLVGQVRDAILISGLVVFSNVVSTTQEIRAKLRLDQIALLARIRVRVIRDGREQRIDPDEVVLGDYLLLATGEQVVADGTLVRSEFLELDESLLTGEADPVPRVVGDEVRSGSFCLAGSGVYVATRVGAASYVQSLTAAAREYRNVRTPLQRLIDRVLQVLLVAVVALSLFQGALFVSQGVSLVEAVRATAVIATLVPQGLLLMSTATYSLGALRVARRNGLVQQLNAVESLSHVDVLCSDKTGTLTRNRLVVRELVLLDDRSDLIVARLADFAASLPEPNSTLRAIAERWPGQRRALAAIVPFHSERKWSGLAFADRDDCCPYVLGAPEVLLRCVAQPVREMLAQEIEQRANAGQRLVLFARAASDSTLRGPDGRPVLPPRLEPLALVALEEDLRPDAYETLLAFERQGVALKLISGDHPGTTLALARRAGLPASSRAISGAELAALTPEALGAVVEETTVFGRVSPGQKQQIVRALADRGHYVAMLGDGANDILALKEAQLGVAMQSGSPAARAVADLILIDDAFDALPATLDEGRRIVSSMLVLIRLFVTRDVATIGLIVAAGLFGLPFPLLPPQVTIVALLTVGIPSLFLVAWARPERPAPAPGAQVAWFALPVGGVSGLAIGGAYVVILLAFDASVGQARSAAVSAALLSGLLVLLMLRHPLAAPLGKLVGDRPMLLLVAGLWLAYLALMAMPAARRYLELELLPAAAWLAVLLVVAACFGGLRLLVRLRRER